MAAGTARREPPELLFRGDIGQAIEDGVITATVRLGRRNARHSRGYVVGERLVVRCFSPTDGSETWNGRVVVNELLFCQLAQISSEDIRECPDDESDVSTLRQRLQDRYGRTLSPCDVVTIVRFHFVGRGDCLDDGAA